MDGIRWKWNIDETPISRRGIHIVSWTTWKWDSHSSMENVYANEGSAVDFLNKRFSWR